MKVIPRSLRRCTRPVYTGDRNPLIHAAEHPLESDAHLSPEGDPDHAGAAFDVAERDLTDSTFHAAVGGVVAVVAHHEDAALLHHERAGSLEDRVLADEDRVPVTVQVLDVHAGDHIDVGVCG